MGVRWLQALGQRVLGGHFIEISVANKFSYSALRDHAALFSQGLPILTYHKVGPRPQGVKWRSLYVSPRLFARQMDELAQAGFRTASLGETRPVAGNSDRKFAVTFDDGYVNVLTHAAPVLARHGFTAIQFIVAGEIGGSNSWDVAEGEKAAPLMDAAQIRDWLAAGHEIGSHTVSHPRLTQLPTERQREEIFASKHRLEDTFGLPVRHFCHPYGDWNEAVRDMVIEAGYETACTHLESGVNTAATPNHALLRIEARYPKRNLRWAWRSLCGLLD